MAAAEMETECWIILIKDTIRQTWCCLPHRLVLFTALTCAVQVDHDAGHEPALSCGTRQVSVINPHSTRGDENPPFAQALPPACLWVPYSTENTPAPLPVCMLQRCAASREFGRQPQSRGFPVPSSHPHWSRPEPPGHYGSHPETKGRGTQSFIHVWRSFGFFNLLFKHSRNIRKAHTLQIIYYYF